MEFHLSARRIRAGARGGALGVSGYVTGRRSLDGVRVHTPHTPDEIALTGLVLPPTSAIRSGIELWRAADAAERKKDGEYRRNGGHLPLLATHADLALPWGVTDAQAQQVIDQVCDYLVGVHRVGVEYAVHKKHGRIDHAHIIWTTRTVGPNGIGAKARSLNAISSRQSGNDGPNAMEEIREIASRAIRDSCGVVWDHRSFKRRGIDKIPEPKLDQRKLREQRRRLAKLGLSEPTQVEHELNLLRKNRANYSENFLLPDPGIKKIPFTSILEVALQMDRQPSLEVGGTFRTNELSEDANTRDRVDKEIRKPKPKPSEEDDDSWTARQIELHPDHRIEAWKLPNEKPCKWVSKVDKVDFDFGTIIPINPYNEMDEDLEIIQTLIYAHINKMRKLRDRAIILLAMTFKRSIQYTLWLAQCYTRDLGEKGITKEFLPVTPFSDKELIRKMRGIPHARIPQGSLAVQVQVAPAQRGKGMLD